MQRVSNKEKLLAEGVRVVHKRGLSGASIRDIAQAAGVPKGSFTNHFGSKEAFGLEIIDRYLGASREIVAKTLRNDTIPPLERLRAYIDSYQELLTQHGVQNGCLYGNMSAEVSEHSEAIRSKIADVFTEVGLALAHCLQAAVQSNELPPDFECERTARFIVSSLQGAILVAKVFRTTRAIEDFRHTLFSTVLNCSGKPDLHLPLA